MRPPHVAFVFVDGVGLGPPGPHNPLSTLDLPALERLAGGQRWTADARPVARPGHLFRAIDATLGVPGLPQSGTGQASLFTGLNCAAAAGRHGGPFPPTPVRPFLRTHGLFARLRRAGRRALFLNAYPERFLEAARARQRWTTTTLMCLAADVPLLGETDLRAGRALAADTTGAGWRTALGRDVPQTTPREAGLRMARCAAEADLTLFEFFLTDRAGHARDADAAARILADLDAFLEGLLEALEPARDLLVVTSDHGNVEDLATRSHTRHAVPLAAYGRGADALADVADLTGVTPALSRLLGAPEPDGTPAAG